jgi:hypothetical protein
MKDSRPPAAPAPGLTDKRSPSRRAPAKPRVQPPLREVLKGLDARELEGQTVFDQLFGPQADDQPR